MIAILDEGGSTIFDEGGSAILDESPPSVLSVNALTRVQVSAFGMLLPSAVYIPPAAGSTDVVWVEILDKNLISQGPVQFVSVQAQIYYNAVGSPDNWCRIHDLLWNRDGRGFLVNISSAGYSRFAAAA
jgi:hypothetical protein